MRRLLSVVLAFVAFVLADTCLWEIINPIFDIAHHGPIHAGPYAVDVVVTALFACLASWCSRRLFERASR